MFDEIPISTIKLSVSSVSTACRVSRIWWLFNVKITDISFINMAAHRCAGGLEKKLDLRSGS